MRTFTLAVVALITAAPVGAMQAPPAQTQPAAQAPAKPAAPAPAAAAQAKPAAPAAQPAKPNAPAQPAAAPVEAAAPPPPPPASVSAGESYTYEPGNRRDPFRDLTKGGNDPKNPGFRPPGIQGMSVNEISVRGVIEKLDGGYVAMIQGPDNKTYAIHTGDRLFDGLVRAVNAEGLVIVQEVNDPLSLVKQREVSKKLRSLEAKE